MKKSAIHTTLIFLITTTWSPLSLANATDSDAAGETKTQIENLLEPTQEPSVVINALLGMSAFEKTGDASQDSSDQAMAGGVTFDIGDKARVVETGLTYFEAKSKNNQTEINAGYIAIPLNAKFYTSGNSQGLFIKGGMLTSFLINTNNANTTRNLDLIGNVGVGGKLKMDSNYDLIVEGTYNRGFLDSLKSKGETYNQGLMIIGGLAFEI